MSTALHLGTQGWNYPAWLGGFYPERTRAADFLALYARAFDTVEVDSTFYAIPPSATVRGWAARTPEHFIFALKVPQEITHEARLRADAGLLEQFVDRARELGPKLGPLLVQLPPDFGPEELPALVDFLPTLPGDLRVAIEFRQRGWLHAGALALLREHRVAVALVDGPWIPRRWMLELVQRPTADFHYIRWMGPDRHLVDHSRVQVDRSRELTRWATALAGAPPAVRAIYGYTSNFFAGHAPASARDVQQLLGIPVTPPDALGEQFSLF